MDSEAVMAARAGQRKSETEILSQNVPKRHRAAILCAEDELSDERIAETVGIARRTLTRWKTDPEFAALVGDYHGKIVGAALKLPIAKKHKRVAVLNDLHTKALQVIEKRAERYASDLDDAESADNAVRRMFGDATPEEAATGLMVRQETANTTGKVTVNWQFDRALVAEIRDLEKQAATELGQWQERAAVEQTTTMVQIIADDEGA